MARSRDNWVEQEGGLPPYVRRIVRRLRQSNPSWTEGHAIAVAINVIKRIAATGDTNFPGKQNVNKKSRAEAVKALVQWEAMKARARAA